MTTIEKQDALLQSLPLDVLKKWEQKPSFKKGAFQGVAPAEEALTEMDLAIHQTPLAVWKQTLNLAVKVSKTGFSTERIEIIEQNKMQATLAEIVQYCRGLNIAFKDFLPELY
jgi:hypothetical protein